MTSGRWRQIERLYHAALECDAAERAAFLSGACGADLALRREVECLLDCRSRAADFIEQPAVPGPLASAVRRLGEASVPGCFVGRTFGSYEIRALIAAGGMGEVYRALDIRLNRTVAIKTLPAHLSDDPDRRERLAREAQIISSLNHPHICTLHDVGVQDGIHYLVMEHVDGDTLQKRLERGPLPLARALEYAIQIVDALDKAHRRGVIHRDLKPGNVMLTKSGVKLLDFGLATRHTPPPAAAFGDPAPDRPNALTAEGAIVGTLQYLSPEQLEGKQADNRTDIFAFGALAYEMITGRTTFPAANQAQLVGAILKDDPQPIVALVPDVPPRLAETLSRCVAKDPDNRWQSANDLLFELRSIVNPPTVDGHESRPRGLPRRIERAAWTAALLACAAIAFVWARTRDGRPVDLNSAAPPIRYTIFPPDGTALYSGYGLPFALSPDGRQIVYATARADGTEQLWLRSLYSQLEQAMPGTEGANTPFWSPDGEWIGFFAANSLKKVRVSSGLTQVVAANVQTKGGATWNADDVIVFMTGPGGLLRVAARGGPVSAATTSSEGSHFWPQFLGDGDHFIYAAASPGGIYLGSLGHEAPRLLMKFPVRISSLAYVPGFVFFVQDAILFVRPFDEKRLAFSGGPIGIVRGIPIMATGRAAFSVSATGVLAYWPYPVGTPAVLQWFERNGHASAAVGTPSQYAGFALSPDASQLAFSRTSMAGADVWVRNLARGGESRLTFDGAAFTPQWSPDGTRIVFTGPGGAPPPKLFIKSIANAGVAPRIGVAKVPNFASSWSTDGRSIVSVRVDPVNHNDLWVHRLQDAVDERLPFNTAFNESHGRISPDNRWIAYDTDASGHNEVWVASFPSGTIRRQVSVDGGVSPEWSDGGNEIVYLSRDNRLMAAHFTAAQATVDCGAPRALFHVENLAELDPLAFPTANAYVAAPDGQRFLVAVRARDPEAPPISIVVNWRALLSR
jgi:serine/threonine protein kinase/Tol biopolymer transport system component